MSNFLRSLLMGRRVSYKGLIDITTGTLLLAGNNFQVINLVKEFILDTEVINFDSNIVFGKRYYKTPLGDIFLRWDRRTKRYIRNQSIDDTLKQTCALACEKYISLEKILVSINRFRLNFKKNIPFQDIIYSAKYEEARHFKQHGYDSSAKHNYPYIVQYADIAKLSFEDAAESILNKAEIENSQLEKSELMRLKYTTMIRDATDVLEIKNVLERFLLDFDIRL